MSEFTGSIPTPQQQRPTLPDTLETSNFYAPFFDVVFFAGDDDHPKDEDGVLLKDKSRDIESFLGDRNISGVGSSPTRLRITTVGGDKTFISALPELRNYRSSLTIEARAAAAYKATLILQPPYEDALALLESKVLTYGSLMEIQWGYMNQATGAPIISDKGLFSIIQPSVSFSLQPTIRINGYDIIAGAQGVERRQPWPREKYKRDVDIVTRIIEVYAKSAKVDISSLKEAEKGKKDSGSPLLRERPGDHIIQTTTDEMFLRRLLLQNNARLLQVGNNYRIEDATLRELAPPSYRLLYFEQPGGTADPAGDSKNSNVVDIPMISFECNSLPSLFAGKGSRGMAFYHHDPDDDSDGERRLKPKILKSPESQESIEGVPGEGADAFDSAGSQQRTGAGTATGVAPATDAKGKEHPTTSGYFFSYPQGEPNTKQDEEQQIVELERTANTHADVVIPGHPTILPLMNVLVEGVGIFGGLYRVLRVTHEVGQGYTTKMRLFRASEKAQKNKSPSQNSEAPTQAENSLISDGVEGLFKKK